MNNGVARHFQVGLAAVLLAAGGGIALAEDVSVAGVYSRKGPYGPQLPLASLV